MDKLELRHVDLYITHTIKGMLADSARYGYVLAYLKRNGELGTKEGYKSINERITTNSIVLSAMEEALKRLTEAVEINIYINSQYIVNMFKTGNVDKWKNNGFKSTKDKEIVDFPKWEAVLGLCEKHVVTVEYVPSHEFTCYLENEMKKA